MVFSYDCFRCIVFDSSYGYLLFLILGVIRYNAIGKYLLCPRTHSALLILVYTQVECRLGFGGRMVLDEDWHRILSVRLSFV